MTTVHPKVYIAYAHGRGVNEDRMVSFANRLRKDGIDANIDLYERTPSGGWPRWTEKQITESDYVVVICDRRLWQKYQEWNSAQTSWELQLIIQSIYDGQTSKFVPVIWRADAESFIPLPLRSNTVFNLGVRTGYSNLKLFLLGGRKYPKPPLGDVDITVLQPLNIRTQRTSFVNSDFQSSMIVKRYSNHVKERTHIGHFKKR